VKRNPWLGCAVMAAALLLSAESLADTTHHRAAKHHRHPVKAGASAVANKPRVRGQHGATTVGSLRHRIQRDDATIRNLANRIQKLEQLSGLRAPASDNPGYNYYGDGTAPAVAQQSAGLRASDRQIAQIAQSPSDVAPLQTAQLQAQSAPAQAPQQQGQFEVSPEAAQHALERALVQTGLLLLRPGQFEIVPSATYQVYQYAQPDQLVLTSTGSVLVSQDQLRTSLVQSQVLGRVGLPWEAQLEVALSYDLASTTTTTQVVGTNLASRTVTANGLGDSSVTLIKQITHEGEWMPNIFVSGSFNLGQQEDGLPLGFGYDYFKAAVVAVKRQDPVVFTAGFAYQTNLSSHGILPGDQFIPSVGMLFALSPETTLQALQEIAFVNGTKFHGETVPGSSQVEGIFQAGILSILAPGVVVNLTAAVAETPQTPDLTVQLSFPIRFN
jgi:hypothetical protein